MKIDDSDRDLVECLQKGNTEAFNKLFGKYAGRLYSFGIKYLRNKDDAEGLVQGVFLKVWLNRKSLKADTAFQSYLFTIAYHDMCNIFRKRITQRKFIEHVSKEVTENITVYDNTAEFKSSLEQVDKLIGQLPEQQRLVFLKSRKEGLSTREIAQELSLSPGTIDNYISSALKFLRKNLGKENLPR